MELVRADLSSSPEGGGGGGLPKLDHELELRGLFYWQVGRLGAFRMYLRKWRTSEQVRKTHSVEHSTDRFDNLVVWIERWQPVNFAAKATIRC